MTASVTGYSHEGQYWDISWWLVFSEHLISSAVNLISPIAASVSIQGVGTVWSGTFTFDWRPSGYQTKYIAEGTTRVYAPPSGSGVGMGDVTGYIAYTGTQGGGGPASVTQAVSLPSLVQAPDAPTDVTAVRNSDTSIALSWTPNPDDGKPYDSQSLSVWPNINGPSTHVANFSGTASAYTFTSAPNNAYKFLVAASNSAGTTFADWTSEIYTTPNPLASLSATSISSGVIRLTLPIRPTPYINAQVVITETHDGGSTWNAKTTIPMSSLSASTTTTWDDTSAETGGTVQYRAIVETTAGSQGTLSSTYKTSNTLVLNTPPNAPTNLTPSGVVDASNPIRLAWTHNPSSDGATQTSRKIDYSDDDGATWTNIVTGNSTTAYYDWSPTLGDFTAGSTILFRVATAGSQAGTYGDYSESQTLTLYGSLAVTLTAGSPPATHEGGPIPVEWSSSATWGTATQTRYQVSMTDQTSGQVVYDTGLIAGTVESATIPSNVQINGHVYTVSVILLDNHQVTSVPATRTVTMDYLSPGEVSLVWTYDDETGSLIFYPTFSEETSSAFDDTYSWMLERSLDGETWEEVGTVTGEWPITDYLVRLGVASWYRSTSYTELGIAGEPTVWDVEADDVVSRWGWLNYGDDYQSRVRFGWSQTVDISAGRASESYEIEGRDYPLAVFGEVSSEKHAITGKLLYGDDMTSTIATASKDDMVTLAKTAGVCVFRDAEGTWFTARVSDMKVSPAPAKQGATEARMSFTVEQVTA